MSSAIKPTDPPESFKRTTLLTDELGELEQKSDKAAEFKEKKSFLDRLKYHLEVLQAHPYLFVVSILVFSALCACGLLIIFYFAKQEKNKLIDEALDLAIETGDFFSDQLDRAILPIFSLAQFVSELDIFGDIPDQIGTLEEPGARPLLSFDAERSTAQRFRNVTGICDDPELVDRFNQIAATIKKNANMEGVLLSLELAPEAVVCVIYPLENSEDFPDGIVVDNSGAVGLDLFASSDNSFTARQSIKKSEISVVGPFPIEYCQEEDCSPETVVQKAFFARLPIRASARQKVVDGVAYNFWGFATGGINWNALIERSNIYETFTEQGLGFQLIRNDILEDLETGSVTKQVVVLAETPEFQSNKSSDTVTTALETTDSEWQMTVTYVHDDGWMVWAIAVTVIVSLTLSLLIYNMLVQKQNYKSIEKKYLKDLAQPQKLRLRFFLEEGASNAPDINIEDLIHNHKPIADFYSNTTVLFCNMDGFTAWSSEREPAQVFTLLQVIFHSFDKIAKSVGVFKVDTVGDRYLAITGFPEAQADHAVRMVNFAQECLTKARELTKRLEMTLGPDTEDLGFCFSLHSGPVTGGVLVGERSRFQLFGETMKTASRLERTAHRNRIQITQATADLLIQTGKRKWIKPREEKVTTKGMDTLQTYWFAPPKKELKQRSRNTNFSRAAKGASSLGVHSEENKSQTEGDGSERASTLWGEEDDDDHSKAIMDVETNKSQRLIEWHVDSMSRLLKMIVARKGKDKKSSFITKAFANLASAHEGETLLDEIVEVIQLPKLGEKSKKIVHSESITLAPEVTSQLREYVKEIAALYRPNPFHNFEHASHVTMSAHKLLNRIVNPDSVDYNRDNVKAVMNDLHNYTFGITSDPLTHFAVVFCALIHDVDHTGVSNAQRGKEEPKLAEHYMNKSLAEQNSVDLSWDVLMQPKYKDLHSCLFSDEKDLMRFRQIVVNIVLATDIFDKEFKELRSLRWDKAFHPDKLDASTGSASPTAPGSSDPSSSDQAEPMEGTRGYDTNRKATIVIEHIMQASDVAHTMQHWHVYKKWNERLFKEMHAAYKMGRSPSDPSQGWYKGELWFFDNYIIPLATKLEECGVFGVASDECLHNALNNRKEWALRGEKIVEEILERCQKSDKGSS